MIVSKNILAFVVRLVRFTRGGYPFLQELTYFSQTAMNASRSIAVSDKEAVQPTVLRKQQIDDFARKYKVDVSLSKFYASQFTMTKS